MHVHGQYLLAVLHQLLEKGSKEGVPVVLAWHIHGPQHTLVDVHRTCSKQQITSVTPNMYREAAKVAPVI